MPGHSHHFHLTKRDEKRFINRLCGVLAVVMPLTTLPQIIMLFESQNAEGLSLTMWVLYTIACIPFLWFGVLYKHRQIVVLNAMWIVMQVIMITGILMYSNPTTV